MRSPAMGGRVGHCKIADRLHLGPWLGMKHDWGWRHYKLKLNEVRDFTLFSVLFFLLFCADGKKFRLNYLSDSAHQRITNNECAVYVYTQLHKHTHTHTYANVCFKDLCTVAEMHFDFSTSTSASAAPKNVCKKPIKYFYQ